MSAKHILVGASPTARSKFPIGCKCYGCMLVSKTMRWGFESLAACQSHATLSRPASHGAHYVGGTVRGGVHLGASQRTKFSEHGSYSGLVCEACTFDTLVQIQRCAPVLNPS